MKDHDLCEHGRAVCITCDPAPLDDINEADRSVERRWYTYIDDCITRGLPRPDYGTWLRAGQPLAGRV